jgi:hypothetical protein
MKTAPQDYLHIAVWGRHLGSYSYYIQDQQYLASEAGAPINAIYERSAPGGERSGTWVTIDECKPDTQAQINEGVEVLKRALEAQGKRGATCA